MAAYAAVLKALKRMVFDEKGYKEIGSVKDLPSHPVIDRGRLVGLWEFDVSTDSIAWTSFMPPNELLTGAVRRMETYIRSDLGDARSFSLDSPKSRLPRIEALRKAQS